MTGNQSIKSAWIACGAVCALALSVLAGSAGIKLEGRLDARPEQAAASGKAKFEAREGRMRFSVQVEDTRNVTRIDVVVDGAAAGTTALDPLSGKFDLNLDSDNGDPVPSLAAGARVEVLDHATGAVILEGNLASR